MEGSRSFRGVSVAGRNPAEIAEQQEKAGTSCVGPCRL